jgi:hypothetical protein
VITQEQLKAIMDYQPLTGIFRWKTSGKNRSVGRVAGWRTTRGYIKLHVLGRQCFAHRLAWLYVHGSYPEGWIDHINHDGTDNRLANLRLSTVSQNHANRRNLRGNLKGASTNGARWRSRIKINKKQFTIGNFGTEQEAHKAYCAEAKRIFGEYHCAG